MWLCEAVTGQGVDRARLKNLKQEADCRLQMIVWVTHSMAFVKMPDEKAPHTEVMLT